MFPYIFKYSLATCISVDKVKTSQVQFFDVETYVVLKGFYIMTT